MREVLKWCANCVKKTMVIDYWSARRASYLTGLYGTGPYFNIKTDFPCIKIPIGTIRGSLDCFIFIMLVRRCRLLVSINHRATSTHFTYSRRNNSRLLNTTASWKWADKLGKPGPSIATNVYLRGNTNQEYQKWTTCCIKLYENHSVIQLCCESGTSQTLNELNSSPKVMLFIVVYTQVHIRHIYQRYKAPDSAGMTSPDLFNDM